MPVSTTVAEEPYYIEPLGSFTESSSFEGGFFVNPVVHTGQQALSSVTEPVSGKFSIFFAYFASKMNFICSG